MSAPEAPGQDADEHAGGAAVAADEHAGGVWRLDRATGSAWWSPGVLRALGLDEASGPPSRTALAELVLPDDRPVLAAALAGAEAGGTARAVRLRVARPDGALRLLAGCVDLDPARGGAVVGCVHDVTAHAARDGELAASEDRLRRTVEGVDAIVVYREHEGDALWFSAQLERILGHDPDRFDAFEDWNALVHPDDLAACRAVWDAEPAEWSLEYRVRRADGSWTWVADRGRRVPASGGRQPGVFSVITDVTERRRVEERLRRLERLEAVGDLAGGLAHHFNNLLTAVMGGVELARAATPPGEAREDLDAALEAAGRAAALTRQMLAFGRRELLEPSATDVAEVVSSFGAAVVALLPPGVRVELEAGPGQVVVDLPRRVLEQLLTSLAMNAAEAMPGGGRLSIRASLVERPAEPMPDGLELAAGRYARVEVADTGRGMDAATAARAFEPFFTTKGPAVGLGMDLPAVYGIVRQAGGTVEVDSEPGAGTTFSIDLPLAPRRG